MFVRPVVFAASLLFPDVASAQSIDAFAMTGIAQLWDDEGNPRSVRRGSGSVLEFSRESERRFPTNPYPVRQRRDPSCSACP
jgi:hypothetical protein